MSGTLNFDAAKIAAMSGGLRLDAAKLAAAEASHRAVLALFASFRGGAK